MKSFSVCFFILLGIVRAEPLPLRVVAANLTSDNKQSYSPDNGNHSYPEGAGARILKALKPDIVMIQEFNTSGPLRQWVNQTFGKDYDFMQEKGMQISNGTISRFPIVESGSWDDPVISNREFAWAKKYHLLTKPRHEMKIPSGGFSVALAEFRETDHSKILMRRSAIFYPNKPLS